MARRYWYLLAGAALAYVIMGTRAPGEPVTVKPSKPEEDPWWKIW